MMFSVKTWFYLFTGYFAFWVILTHFTMGSARVALVTGGSRGIGLAVAQQLHRNGWKVALTSRDMKRAQQAASSIAPDVVPVAYEAQATPAAELVAQVARDCGGSISALVNAAGISQDSLLLRLKKDQLESQLATNLVGPIEMSKAVVKGMLSQRRGESAALELQAQMERGQD